MREEYDFSSAEKNPYAKPEKATITIRLDRDAVAYFKALSAEVNIPYQIIINSYLADCAKRRLKPSLTWESR